MFRWIQVMEEEAKYLEDKGTLKKEVDTDTISQTQDREW
jgi:hypothetical protein